MPVLNKIIFIKQKQCRRIKKRIYADGKKQRRLFTKLDDTSPTVKIESVILSILMDYHEHPYVVIVDLPGAFLHVRFENNKIVHMRLEGVMAEAMFRVVPETYGKYVS